MVQLSPAMARLAGTIRALTPPDAVGFQLHRHGSKEGNGLFLFPVPGRRTKRANGSQHAAPLYRLQPFEPPRGSVIVVSSLRPRWASLWNGRGERLGRHRYRIQCRGLRMPAE